MARPRRPINHGTQGGYSAHRNRQEEPCDACKEATRAASRERKTGGAEADKSKARLGAPTSIPQSWKDRAACQDADPEIFFPDTRTETDANRARAWCRACPVRTECLDYAMDHGKYGVWGGLTEQERRLEYRRRQRRESMARSRAQQREAS